MRAINDLRKMVQITVITVILCFSNSIFAEHHEFGGAADWRATEVLSKDLLKGPHQRVEDQVQSDGYLNDYTINSDYGEFEAFSTAMLRTRIGGIDALAELDDLSHTGRGRNCLTLGSPSTKTLQR
jgi:hypothetical protein